MMVNNRLWQNFFQPSDNVDFNIVRHFDGQWCGSTSAVDTNIDIALSVNRS